MMLPSHHFSFSLKSPALLAKKPNQLKPKDSPVSLKGKKDGTLQKIGDFIQSSPTLLGSKGQYWLFLGSVDGIECFLTSPHVLILLVHS